MDVCDQILEKSPRSMRSSVVAAPNEAATVMLQCSSKEVSETESQQRKKHTRIHNRHQGEITSDIEYYAGTISAQSDNSMDEVQFNASLDALLAGENLNANENGNPACNTYPILSSQSAHDWLAQSSTAGISHALNRHRPSDTAGFEAMSMQAPNTHGTQSVTPMNYYANFLSSYGSIGSTGNQMSSTGHSIASSGDAVSVTSSRSGGRMSRSGRQTENSKTCTTLSRKHGRDPSSVSEDEGERHRRREDRNAREQQRSQKITEQIEHLRDVLVSANVQFKPDKYSTLVTAAEYIQKLQERSAMLDIEHKKLVDTISRTNEMVNEQYIPASTMGVNPPGSSTIEGTTSGAQEQKDALFLSSIDYKAIFEKCGVPLAVLSVDGRFLECNGMFERLTGYTRDELLPTQRIEADRAPTSSSSELTTGDIGLGPPAPRNMSLFNLLVREHMEHVFMAMSEMLRQSPDEVMAGTDGSVNKDFWSGVVALSRNMEFKLRMDVSLVRSPDARAKFFDCSLVPVEDMSLEHLV